MKKALLIISVLFAVAHVSMADDIITLGLSVGIIKTQPAGNPIPRTPVQPPHVGQDGGTLLFSALHPSYTLYLVDTSGDDNEVVFTTYVSTTVNSVVLPTTLSGTYELRLVPDDSIFYFYGDITL